MNPWLYIMMNHENSITILPSYCTTSQCCNCCIPIVSEWQSGPRKLKKRMKRSDWSYKHCNMPVFRVHESSFYAHISNSIPGYWPPVMVNFHSYSISLLRTEWAQQMNKHDKQTNKEVSEQMDKNFMTVKYSGQHQMPLCRYRENLWHSRHCN